MSLDGEHPLAARVYLPPTTAPRAAQNPVSADERATDPAVLAAADSYFNDPDRLHGDKVPTLTLIREQPIHRLMIFMHAQGAKVEDIAAHTGYTRGTVYKVLRQPWARQRLLQILKESGMDAVKHFLTHEVAPSLEVLREIRDGDIPGKTSDRAAAANSILDRALGKPTVHVESDNTNRTVPADLQRIESEIDAVRKQLAERGQSN